MNRGRNDETEVAMNARALRRIERLNYILGGVLAAASAVFLAKEQALGMLVGVILGSVNFSLLSRIVQRWLRGAEKGTGAGGYFLIPKMGALLVAVFLALRFLPISPVYFAIGFSIFLLSIAIETVRFATNPSDDEVEEDAA